MVKKNKPSLVQEEKYFYSRVIRLGKRFFIQIPKSIQDKFTHKENVKVVKIKDGNAPTNNIGEQEQNKSEG